MRFIVGLDLGQTRDFTALVILERKAQRYDLRHLERFRDKSYVDVVAHVAQLLERLESRYDRPQIEITKGIFVPGHLATLVVDQTGAGRPVVDMFVDAQLPSRLIPVTITAGHSVTSDGKGGVHVPKKDLVVSAKCLLQTGRLKISRELKLTEILLQELDTFQIKISTAANELFGTWREGQHDDMVLALSLATWAAEHMVDQTAVRDDSEAVETIVERPETVYDDLPSAFSDLDLE